MQSSKKKRDIKLGTVSATAEELNFKDAKIRVTMMIDLVTVEGFRQLAQKTGSKYQTLMNQKLGEALQNSNEKLDLIARLSKLEEYVYGKKEAG